MNSSEYRPSSSRTFQDYVENCWLPEMLPTLKYSTKRFYQYMLKVHLCPVFGEMQLRLINRDAVQLFLAEKLRSGLSWRTVESLRTSFGTIMAAAEAAELIPSNSNFRYNFAFVFKRRVFICLGVLILDRRLPENL